MNKIINHCLKPLAVVAALTCGLGSVSAWAAPAAGECEQSSTGSGMSEPFYKAMEKVNEQIANKQYAPAIDQLKKMLAGNVSDYEKANAYYNLGYAYSLQDNLNAAGSAFVSALDLNSLPAQQQEQLKFNAGQTFIVDKNYDKGIPLIEDFIGNKCVPVPADAYVFLASAYAEQKQFRKAITQIDQAIAKSGKPKESWVQLKLAAYFELKDYKGAADALVQLIAMAPTKPDYWRQLSGIFLELKQDKDALATLALAERQGMLSKPNEIKNLYNVYMMLEIPYKAGALIEKAMKDGTLPRNEDNLKLLSDAWINAREADKAEATLKTLAEQSSKGEYYYKLGAMFGDTERWKDSIDMLQKGIDKGLTDRYEGDSWMRIAVAYYNLNEVDPAIKALKQAKRYSTVRQEATQWLSFITGQPG